MQFSWSQARLRVKFKEQDVRMSSVFVSLRFLPQLAETRREFVRIGEDLETAAVKNAQVSRHKSADAERASHLLLATRKCYQHFALDYCLQVHTRYDISSSPGNPGRYLQFNLRVETFSYFSLIPSRLSRRLTSWTQWVVFVVVWRRSSVF